MPRLYREAPVNAIWEGSGNVQCLDVLRAIRSAPASLDGLFRRGRRGARRASRALDAHVDDAESRPARPLRFREPGSRPLRPPGARPAGGVVSGARRLHADAFCRSRLEARGAPQLWRLPRGLDFAAIVERAAPR